MLRIAIMAAACVAVRAQDSARLVNKNGNLEIKLADANSMVCINGGDETGCFSAADVVTKPYVNTLVENVKTEFLEKTAKQLDARIEVLETDLNDKVDKITETIDGLCKWGFEYMDANSVCQSITECVVGSNYEVDRPTASSQRRCANVKQCSSSEFEVVAPGYNQNRVCQKVTTCSAGVEWLVAAATDTADANCAPVSHCSHLEYEESGPTANADRVCKTITVCDLKKQWIKKAATKSANTVCGPLYTTTTGKDGGSRGRAGDSCEAVQKVRDGKVKGCLFKDEGVWIRIANKPVTVVCMGDVTTGFKVLKDGQTLATKTTASCEELFHGLGGLEGSAFHGKSAGDSTLFYTTKGIKTCQLGANGKGTQLPHGGKLKYMLDNGNFKVGLKPEDFVFWIDSIHAQPESGAKVVDLVNNVEFEWFNRGRSYKLKQDKSPYHNSWWFEGYGYLRKSHEDLKAFGLPSERKDRTIFAWAKPSREQGWINHVMHYGYTNCGRAYGLGYTHYSGKHWVGNHKWCGGYGFRGAEWPQRQLKFVGSQMKGGKMRTFTVMDSGGKQRVVWGTQSKTNEHNTYINARPTDSCRGYLRIGSRLCDWEWYYGGISSMGMTKTGMADNQILAVYKASVEWRSKRD